MARELLIKLLEARRGQHLTNDELVRVGRVLLEGPMSQELKQSQGKAASLAYVTEVLTKVQPMAEQSQHRSRDQGMER